MLECQIGRNLTCYTDDARDKYDNYSLVMPNKKLTKEENQPSIKSLLPSCTETVECINVEQEGANIKVDINNSIVIGALKTNTVADLTSPQSPVDQTLNAPDLLDFREVKSTKKRKRKNRSSGSPQNQLSKKVNTIKTDKMSGQNTPPHQPRPHALEMNTEVILSPELLELERRMIVNIADGIKTALKPIQDSIDKIQKSSDLILQQEITIKKLTAENKQLLNEVNQVKRDLDEYKERLFNLENKSLEYNLIFRGVDKPQNETPEGLKERLYWTIADTINNPNPAQRLSTAKEYSIRYCR